MSGSGNWRASSWRSDTWGPVDGDILPSTELNRNLRSPQRNGQSRRQMPQNQTRSQVEPYERLSSDKALTATSQGTHRSSWRTGAFEASDPNEHRRPQGVGVGPGYRPNDRLPRLRPSEREESTGPGVQAVFEGRRVYLGSLPYDMKPPEIERYLADHKCMAGFVSMHISVDPFTGKHPGYCFIEYEDIDAADHTMETMNGLVLQGRQVKCRPCNPKGQTLAGRRDTSEESAFDRWGEWSSRPPEGRDAGPNQALARFQNRSLFEDRRLFVGNLPRMHDQAMNHAEMKSIFKDYKVEAISKRYGLYEETKDGGTKTRQNYCHVDFATREVAAEAKKAMHGREFRGAQLVVDWARQDQGRLGRRH